VGFSGEKWYRKKRFSKRFDAGEEMRQHRYTHALRHTRAHTQTTITTVYIVKTYMYSTKVGQL